MDKTKVGGPAFPSRFEIRKGSNAPDGTMAESDQQHVFFGMTLRDYFAAHAPEKPQKWFTPTMPPKPDPIWPCSLTSQHIEGCHCQESEAMPENWQERHDYGLMAECERLLQWPYAWADAMLARREFVE